MTEKLQGDRDAGDIGVGDALQPEWRAKVRDRRPLWFACQEERPSDLHTVWHVRDCAGCRVKAAAELRQAEADPNGERARYFLYFGGPPQWPDE